MSVSRTTASSYCALFGLILAAMHAPAANAYEYCVGNIDQLNTALGAALIPNGQTTVIKIQQGTYTLAGSEFFVGHAAFNSLQLLGGYNSDCSQRTLDPANTIFDGGNVSQYTYLFFAMRGDLTIEGIFFANINTNSGTIIEPEDTAAHIQFNVRNNVFAGDQLIVGGYGTSSDFQISYQPIVRAEVRNNLFFANTFSQPMLQLIGLGAGAAAVSNTIADSRGDGIWVCDVSDMTIADNVLWNNADHDIRVTPDCTETTDPAPALVQFNLYSSALFTAASGSGSNVVGSDPLFVNDTSSGLLDYHLKSSSPAINTGTTSVTLAGVDLDGKARIAGSTVDMGAYESSIDDTISSVLTVTNTNDDGAGSLRKAMVDANNAASFNYIEFNIPGSCPLTISPVSDLPSLTFGTKVDGFSQPGSVWNTAVTGDSATRCIILNGAGARTNGIGFSGDSTTHLWVQGLVFEGFAGAALSLGGGNQDLVLGNQFGGRIGGAALAANGTDIKLAASARNAFIGDDAPAFRNVIAGATNYGISVGALGSFTTGHQIVGNLIGAYGNEFTGPSAGNAVGVHIVTGGNTVRDNVIVDNLGNGIELSGTNAQGNLVWANLIGRGDPFCLVIGGVKQCLPDNAPNTGNGVSIDAGAHDNFLLSNTIWYNGADGVSVSGAGKGNGLQANSIYANTGFGIDLVGVGANDNDADSGAASLPNRGLNFPLISRAYGGIRYGWVEGSLSSTNDNYVIEAYSSTQVDNEATGEGQTYSGATYATIAHAPVGGNGTVAFRFPIFMSDFNLNGRFITATAIDSSTNTSGFSFPVAYLCDVIFSDDLEGSPSNACPAP